MEASGGQEPPIPAYVLGESERERWRRSEQLAMQVMGSPATDPVVMEMTRTIWGDKDTYPD
jgi:hypothetical protein